MNGGSFFLTAKLAMEAVLVVLPAIEAMMETGRAKRRDLQIIVMDPAKPFGSGATFTSAILYEHQLGDSEAWEHDYYRVARSKAEVSWRTGFPSHLVQQRMPYLYQDGDTRWGGSVVLEGQVVGVSGVQWYWDEMFSYWIAAACRALSIEAAQVVYETDIDFLGG